MYPLEATAASVAHLANDRPSDSQSLDCLAEVSARRLRKVSVKLARLPLPELPPPEAGEDSELFEVARRFSELSKSPRVEGAPAERLRAGDQAARPPVPLLLPVRNDAASSAKDGVADVIVEAVAVSRIDIGASTDCIALLAETSGRWGDRRPEVGT